MTVHQFFCILHFCHTCSLCHVELVVQFPTRGSTQVLLCLFPGVLWLWPFIYSVGPHFVVSQVFMASAASKAGDANSSRAPGLTSGLQGSVNVHRGDLLLVPQWQCISSFVFYIDRSVCICFTSKSTIFQLYCDVVCIIQPLSKSEGLQSKQLLQFACPKKYGKFWQKNRFLLVTWVWIWYILLTKHLFTPRISLFWHFKRTFTSTCYRGHFPSGGCISQSERSSYHSDLSQVGWSHDRTILYCTQKV